MKTAYYTFTAWEDGAMAAGGDSGLGGERRAALVRRPAGEAHTHSGDKVIDLNAWRTDALEEDEVRGELDWDEIGPDWPEEEPPSPRPRRSRRAMLTAELVSTLCVVAVALVIIVRVLTF
mgnify:FL=1